MRLIDLSASLFHGTLNGTIDRFDIRQCIEHNPFGPAVYLTSNIDTARHYARHNGIIYEVSVAGDPHFYPGALP
jgi:hypothetical protein